MTTKNLSLPLISEGQAQAHVTHNEALVALDAVHNRTALSATTLTPPTATDGDIYILPNFASGFGTATPGQIALRTGGIWVPITPAKGETWNVIDEAAPRTFTGAEWFSGTVAGDVSSLGLRLIEVELTCNGPAVTAAGLLPDRAIVLGVTSYVTEAITGATSYSTGLTGEVDKFGGSLGVSLADRNIGIVGPFAVYSNTDVTITANGSDFTGGKVMLAASLIMPGVKP
ncbi:DUF2793 domain-containing protein [Roseobacter litoralis]|uniref:DUF2793 domain-containing protein n=1 Tax=Roseobacter litoralis TaxID=42443 RepID=UPI0024958177|nr:DUF2793 domain-containing protein [Roseobacter litoralis]